jgi:hypothetical protein
MHFYADLKLCPSVESRCPWSWQMDPLRRFEANLLESVSENGSLAQFGNSWRGNFVFVSFLLQAVL